jgi:predicted neutral ceramidase superfamily lipid hydrolase
MNDFQFAADNRRSQACRMNTRYSLTYQVFLWLLHVTHSEREDKLSQDKLFIISFIFFFSISFYVGWENLGSLLGCDYLSYGLGLLRFWICVLMILAREPILRSSYYPGLFLCFVVLLVAALFCTFRRISLFSFSFFFWE